MTPITQEIDQPYFQNKPFLTDYNVLLTNSDTGLLYRF